MSNQHIEPELTVGEIIKVYLSHWRMFAVLAGVLFFLCTFFYVYKIPYVASSTIVINDSQNSSLQAFSHQFFGLSKSVQEAKKGSSLLSKHIEYLKTREFYEKLLAQMESRGNSPLITMDERKGYELLKVTYLDDLAKDPTKKISFLQKLDSWIKIQQDSEFEVKVSAATPNKAMSLFLSNAASDLAAKSLKDRELAEIHRVEEFITKQKEDADSKIASYGQELAGLQNKDENLLPLAAQAKMGDYVSDLIMRANELRLKMAENKKMMEYLGKGQTGQGESSLYGTGGRIETLKVENSMLAARLAETQSSIERLKQEAKQLPFQAQMVDELKKKAEMEFTRYKELSTALAKVDVQKISIDTRFEVLEFARWDNTAPQVGLMTLALISLLVSQFLGSMLIYFRYLWNPDIVTAQASRNLLIFDNHSADPRVIIENSKIKFSLKNPEPSSNEIAAGEQPKKLGWNVFNWGRGSDLTQ